MTKRCSTCRKRKPLKAFNRKKDGLQGNCRDCSRLKSASHYNNNKQKYFDSARKRRQLLLFRVWEIKASNPCERCGGYFPPFCMEFHHGDDNKEVAISRLISNKASWSRIMAEIKKCDLYCANCHKIESFSEIESYLQFLDIQGAVV